ncbi:hypothetical protein QAD02_014673 [Eretmocerus hayati]|uniref:Uncharacterized protein n=1 Tax=Eretmocerus hayati TaxID=131215 RepID=A0ACC2P779_9HYME|nr:hypothetical protein QAD02_014673 [Eretmocerus hayati]
MSTYSLMQKRDLLYLLYRIREPIYYPKGRGEDLCILEISPEYLPEQYRGKADELLSRFSKVECRRIQIGTYLTIEMLKIPLDQVLRVKRRDPFSLFIPMHCEAASSLIEIFIGLRNMNEVMAFGAYARERVNPELFAYALSTALVHRRDTRDLTLPSHVEMFPEKFLYCETITEAKESAEILQNASSRVPIQIPTNFTGNDSDPEHRLAYFREDIGVNSHHWHWHLIYPFLGPFTIVNKDRRGELFFYFHHEMMARYNIERLCNNLTLVERLLDLDAEIPGGYYSMLNIPNSSKYWPGRPDNMKLRNINRPDASLAFDIEDLKRFKERIYESIHRKRIIAHNGLEINLNNESGVDVLGNVVEASILSPNSAYYGSLHVNLHLAIAYIHDPQNKHLQTPGVLSDPTTAMRDPIFYKLHAFVDDILYEHKNTLTPYDLRTLSYPGMQLLHLEVCSYADKLGIFGAEPNKLYTFMENTDIDLSRGLDFASNGPVLVRITHLNHSEFQYRLTVRNGTGRKTEAIVRLFMAPTQDLDKVDLRFAQQKNLMIGMDTFVTSLDPGDNIVLRESTHSSYTIPFEQTFPKPTGMSSGQTAQEMSRSNYCGCGWPQHMLLPRGAVGKGYSMVLFAMITDYNLDRVIQDESAASQNSKCKPSFSFCGLENMKYPDRRPMGFPFDRAPREGVQTLQQFLTANMITTPITIIHLEEVRNGRVEPAILSASETFTEESPMPSVHSEREASEPEPDQSPKNKSKLRKLHLSLSKKGSSSK